MLEIVRIEPPWEENNGDEDNDPRAVYLRGEMENVTADGDEMIAGYMVTKVQTGRHDGEPAWQFTLADSLGEREVGRLIVRKDAYRDALLEWTRLFPEPQGTHGEARLDDFLYEAGNLSEIPAGFHFVPARKIDIGDVTLNETAGYESKSTVVDLRYGTAPEASRYAGVDAGDPMVEFLFKHDDGSLSEWCDYGLEYKICRKD